MRIWKVKRGPWLGLLSMALLLALVVGCTKTTYKNGLLETEQTVYKVQAPGPGWEQIQSADADLAFWHSKNDAFIMVNSSCDDYRDAPVRALANHLFFGIEKKEFLVQKEVEVDGRMAWYSIVTGQLDGAPVKVAAYTLVKNYCTYDLSYSAPPTVFDVELQTFESLVDRFAVVKRKRN